MIHILQDHLISLYPVQQTQKVLYDEYKRILGLVSLRSSAIPTGQSQAFISVEM